MRVALTLGISLALLAPAPLRAEPQIVNLVQMKVDDLDAWERHTRTSASRPLSMADLEQLAAAGVGNDTLLELMRTRRVLTVADAPALIRLKKAGASDAVIAAMSAYALPPNRTLDLRVHLDVSTPYSIQAAPFLYLELWQKNRGVQEAFLFADLRALLTGPGVEVAVDRSDPLLPSKIRTTRFSGQLGVRNPGNLEMRALISNDPSLRTLEGLPDAEAKRVQRFPFEYPAVSEERLCIMDLVVGRDALIEHLFSVLRADLRCYWE